MDCLTYVLLVAMQMNGLCPKRVPNLEALREQTDCQNIMYNSTDGAMIRSAKKFAENVCGADAVKR